MSRMLQIVAVIIKYTLKIAEIPKRNKCAEEMDILPFFITDS